MGVTSAPKFRRRKADRPQEIASAALAVFAERGFAAATLDEIAARAGLSKGAIYLYFPNKREVFRAVVERAVAPGLDGVRTMVATHPGPFTELARTLAARLGRVAVETPAGGVLKMVIGEARNFPELARIWHDHLVAPGLAALAHAVSAAQARGELRAGDPRGHALSLIAPLVAGIVWRETFTPIGAPAFDIPALLNQHVETVLHGMVAAGGPS